MFKIYFGAATATYGGRNRARTCDPLIKSQLLYQLSYTPGLDIRSVAGVLLQRAVGLSKLASARAGSIAGTAVGEPARPSSPIRMWRSVRALSRPVPQSVDVGLHAQID